MRKLLVSFCILGTNLSLVAEGTDSETHQNLEQSIDRIISIFSDDVATNEDLQFVMSVPKEVVPLLMRRLEMERKTPFKYSSAFGLLANKLKQFEGEIPKDVKDEAINLMVKTCESADDNIVLMYLSGFRGFKDLKIIEMARRMQGRPDINIQKSTTRLLDSNAATAPTEMLTPKATPLPKAPAPPKIRIEPSAPSSPAPIAAENAALAVERESSVWSWFAGITALLAAVALILKRRTDKPH